MKRWSHPPPHGQGSIIIGISTDISNPMIDTANTRTERTQKSAVVVFAVPMFVGHIETFLLGIPLCANIISKFTTKEFTYLPLTRSSKP